MRVLVTGGKGVMTLEIREGVATAIRTVIHPEKLQHAARGQASA